MSRAPSLSSLLPAILLGGAVGAGACNDDVPACFRDDCRESCLAGGYAEGICAGTVCRCLAGGDADVAAGGDVEVDVDAGEGDDAAADTPLEEDGPAGDAPVDETPACPAWSDVEGIFRGNCGRCHPNYRTYDDVRSNLSLVRAYIAMGHYIYGAQRELVLRWIDCGGPP
jgi:hypothetical protein